MKRSILVLIAFFFLTSFLFSQTIQWEQLSGPHGGAIYSIVTDNAGNMYASAMWNIGPFKSTDNGETWFSIKNGLDPASQYCPMNIGPNGDLFIAGVYNSDFCIYRSTDAGESWTVSLNTAGWSIFCISFDQDSNIYVATYSGIYKSTNNGENWTPYGTFTGRAVAIAVNDSGHVFVGDYGIFYRSTDDGVSWTQLAVGGGTTIAINNYGHLFVGCSGNGGILRSTNNGESWTYVYPAYTIQIQEASTVLIDVNDDIYFPTYDGKGVIKSTDNGDTWTEMNNNLGYKYLRVVSKNLSDDFFAAGDYAIYKSTDNCTSWHSVGLNLCNVKKIAINSDDDIFTAELGVNRSTDLGQTWETINNGLTNLDTRTIVIKNDGTVFCGAGFSNSDQGVIFRSTDNGNNWVRADTGIAWSTHLNAMAVDITGNIYAGAYDGVYKSTNNGSSWINIGGAGGAKELAFNSTGDLFLASYGGGFWKLPDGDTTWVDLTSNIGSNYIFTLFIGSNDYIYTHQKRSTDNGQTWTNYSVGEFVYAVAENSAGHLFFGTNDYGQGVYRSFDFGSTWELISNGLPTPGLDINSLAVDSEDYLYAGTNGMSMFKTTSSTVFHFDDPSLIAHYTFDGNANDLSGYDNHGNVIGAALTTDRFGAENSAYEFNGSSNYISIPNSLSLQSPTTELTQLVWVNIYSWTGQGFWVPVLMKSNSGDNAFQYRLSIESNGVNTSINNWNNAVIIPDTVSFNSWYMVVSTLKNDTVKVYVNGIFKGSGTLTGPIMQDTKPLEIGRDVPGSTEYFHGKIDEIRIYNRAITEREIDSLYDGVVSIPYEDKLSIPMSFSLEQNYPNPFNPSTKISWQSPVGSWQTIKLFDVLGREIETIVDGYYEAGPHSTLYIVNSSLSSDVYFYQLITGDFVQTRKMILLR